MSDWLAEQERLNMNHKNAFVANRLNLETGQWEYAPRYVELISGRLISQDCAGCGQSIDVRRRLDARCTDCQIKAKSKAE